MHIITLYVANARIDLALTPASSDRVSSSRASLVAMYLADFRFSMLMTLPFSAAECNLSVYADTFAPYDRASISIVGGITKEACHLVTDLQYGILSPSALLAAPRFNPSHPQPPSTLPLLSSKFRPFISVRLLQRLGCHTLPILHVCRGCFATSFSPLLYQRAYLLHVATSVTATRCRTYKPSSLVIVANVRILSFTSHPPVSHCLPLTSSAAASCSFHHIGPNPPSRRAGPRRTSWGIP